MHAPTLSMYLHMHNILVHMCGRSREMAFISFGLHKEKVPDFCISKESSKLEVTFICDCRFLSYEPVEKSNEAQGFLKNRPNSEASGDLCAPGNPSAELEIQA